MYLSYAIRVCISIERTLPKVTPLVTLFTTYLEFDTFIPLSSSNGYIVFHATLCIPAGIAKKKNYIARVPPRSFSRRVPALISFLHLLSFHIRPRDRGKVSRQDDGRPWIPRGDEDRCRAPAYWQTFSNFTPIWPGAAPVILRLFAPRRIATLYVHR